MVPENGLVALVADKDIEVALSKVFSRPDALGIQRFQYEILRHPHRDNGCRAQAANYLRQYLRKWKHALVVFDRHGCGSSDPRDEIEVRVEQALSENGWETRARALVVNPEFEAWVWSGSAHVSRGPGWGGDYARLRARLMEAGLWPSGEPKPPDPKEAVDFALLTAPRTTRIRRSARIFGEIADRVSLHGCNDPAFRKLCATLEGWFGSGEN